MLKGIGDLLSLLNRGKECSVVGHEFYCTEVKGRRGEIAIFRRRLTSQEVSRLSADPAAATEVCPGQQVICRRCRRPFPGDNPDSMPPLPSVDPHTFLG